MTDLNLEELDRLELEELPALGWTSSGQRYLTPEWEEYLTVIDEQLRPLLDLVDGMGKALRGLSLTCTYGAPKDCQCSRCFARAALDDYRRAKGEK